MFHFQLPSEANRILIITALTATYATFASHLGVLGALVVKLNSLPKKLGENLRNLRINN
jgi:hypothetical protein